MKNLEKQTTTVAPSKFNPHKNVVEKLEINDIEINNDKFWEQQSVNLHKCYKQGQAFANNSNKKTVSKGSSLQVKEVITNKIMSYTNLLMVSRLTM